MDCKHCKKDTLRCPDCGMKEWNEFAYRHKSEAFVRDSINAFNDSVRKKEKKRKVAVAIKSICIVFLVLAFLFAFAGNANRQESATIDLEHSSK